MSLPDQQLLAYATAGAALVVGALQLHRPRTMHVNKKIRHGAVGDWVVYEADGDKYFMSPEAFGSIFTRSAGNDTLAYIANGYALVKLT